MADEPPRILYEQHRDVFRGVLREPRGRGGAVPERDETGVQPVTAEERMAMIERGYGPDWCPVTPDMREGVAWLAEVFTPHE